MGKEYSRHHFYDPEEIRRYTDREIKACAQTYYIDPSNYDTHNVKRGLRDNDGNGVVTGLTKISMINAKKRVDGKLVPIDGQLYYRGYNIYDLIARVEDGAGFGYERVAYLLLYGELPNETELDEFRRILNESRSLPVNFVRDVIMKASTNDIMNSMMRSILTLQAYDSNARDISLENVLRQSLMLISVFPMLAVYGYHAYNHYENDESMYIHRPDDNISFAGNLLRLLRPDKSFTPGEEQALDAALILHMEHGGGNNSTFTTRTVTSSGADTYSVIAAAMASLSGPRHGGANIKVRQMMEDIEKNVHDHRDKDELNAYLLKLLNGEAFDRSGLIYGIGHAIYSVSDPRAGALKTFTEQLAREKGRYDEFEFYTSVAEAAPQIISGKRKMYKGVSANVDFYSGFLYNMLGIPEELFTPMFAIARIVGWSAHRIEELAGRGKIIRPAYESLMLIRDLDR